MKIKAAVTYRQGENFKIEQITLDEPKAGEVLVRIAASGICATDIHVQNQEYAFPLPAVLGHEGSGVVEKVGEHVHAVKIGDHVVLSYAYCGHCKACRAGTPFECDDYDELNFGGKMADGSSRIHQNGQELSVFFGQSSFATHVVVNRNSIVKVNKDIDLTLLGALGCGIQTGSGTVLNLFQLGPGSSIAVFGAGAVGMSAIMAAKLVGSRIIIAVDRHEHRLNLARDLGATHVLNAGEVDVIAEIKRITGSGVQYVLEATGHSSVADQAVDALDRNGRLAYVAGSPNLSEDAMRKRKLTIMAVIEGNSVPQVFIPRLIEFYKLGKFPFDKLVKYYPFEEINRAVADARSGATIKPVITMP